MIRNSHIADSGGAHQRGKGKPTSPIAPAKASPAKASAPKRSSGHAGTGMGPGRTGSHPRGL